MSRQAAEFAARCRESWPHNVTYNAAKEAGVVNVPNVGTIHFREASNDPAVILLLAGTLRQFKGCADVAFDFITALQEAWSNSD